MSVNSLPKTVTRQCSRTVSGYTSKLVHNLKYGDNVNVTTYQFSAACMGPVRRQSFAVINLHHQFTPRYANYMYIAPLCGLAAALQFNPHNVA